ncbi:MAG: flavodoxin family protein [Dehalococcoidia bacterium]
MSSDTPDPSELLVYLWYHLRGSILTGSCRLWVWSHGRLKKSVVLSINQEVRELADIAVTKKVLVILGSPRRNGNSAALAARIARGAESLGGEVETVFLQELDIIPCRGCDTCKKRDSKGCAINDDMQDIYLKLIRSDAWVIASPVYWFTMSAQTKIFMDRCYALPAYADNPFAGKRIAIAMSYGDADAVRSGCVNALRTFQDAYRYTGSKLVGMVYGSAVGAGEIENNEVLMREAEELGKRLVAPSRRMA